MTDSALEHLDALKELRLELTQAIARQNQRSRTRRPRALALVVAAAVVCAAVIAVLVEPRGTPQTLAARELERVAAVASRLNAPSVLQPGEYWYTRSEITTPLPESLPGRHPTYIELIQRVVTETWTSPTGLAHVATVPVGRPTFRSARDRQRWLAAGSPPMESFVGAQNQLLHGTDTFPPELPLFTYAQVKRLPTNPSKLLAQIREAFDRYEKRHAPAPRPLTSSEESTAELNTIEGLLFSPVSSAVRAGLYRAAARIPGIRYIGTTTDPLGRRGAAIELDTSGASGPQHRRIIYDPQTSALLAELSDFGGPPHAGVYDAESFIASSVVPSATAIPPGLPPIGHGTPLAQRLHPR